MRQPRGCSQPHGGCRDCGSREPAASCPAQALGPPVGHSSPETVRKTREGCLRCQCQKLPARKVWDKVLGSVDPRSAAGLPFLRVPETLEFGAFRDSAKFFQRFAGILLGKIRSKSQNQTATAFSSFLRLNLLLNLDHKGEVLRKESWLYLPQWFELRWPDSRKSLEGPLTEPPLCESRWGTDSGRLRVRFEERSENPMCPNFSYS